jgi:transposase, IS5 family
MRQLTLATAGFERYAKNSRRAAFLAEMDRTVPWRELCALIEPVHPTPGNGRQPVGLERMLRMYFLQLWFNLSDPAVEEALYESVSMRQFVGIDLGRERVHEYLEARGIKVNAGTIVDATIISAPSSTKNATKSRDPEMHQTKKGNQWYFGMKAHFGVDSKTKVIHAVVATAANVTDATVLLDLLHGEETRVWGDQAYKGQGEVIRKYAPNASPTGGTGIAGSSMRRRRRGTAPSPGQGRAQHRRDQTDLRLRQGALPRTRQERTPFARHRGVGQSVHYPPSTRLRLRGGVYSPHRWQDTTDDPQGRKRLIGMSIQCIIVLTGPDPA